jgi:hypothetical protein
MNPIFGFMNKKCPIALCTPAMGENTINSGVPTAALGSQETIFLTISGQIVSSARRFPTTDTVVINTAI